MSRHDMYRAALSFDCAAVTQMLNDGYPVHEPHSCGSTPLYVVTQKAYSQRGHMAWYKEKEKMNCILGLVNAKSDLHVTNNEGKSPALFMTMLSPTYTNIVTEDITNSLCWNPKDDSSIELLFRACQFDRIDLIRTMIAKKIDVNQRDRCGQYVLQIVHKVVHPATTPVVICLLEAKAHFDPPQATIEAATADLLTESPIHAAYRSGICRFVQLYLAFGLGRKIYEEYNTKKTKRCATYPLCDLCCLNDFTEKSTLELAVDVGNATAVTNALRHKSSCLTKLPKWPNLSCSCFFYNQYVLDCYLHQSAQHKDMCKQMERLLQKSQVWTRSNMHCFSPKYNRLVAQLCRGGLAHPVFTHLDLIEIIFKFIPRTFMQEYAFE